MNAFTFLTLFVGTNGNALIIGSRIVGRITDIILERAVLKIGLLMSTLSGTVLLVLLLEIELNGKGKYTLFLCERY